MHIEEFKSEFIKNYFDIRYEEIINRVNSKNSLGNSNNSYIKEMLSKSLNLVFSNKYGFFNLPLIGVNIDEFFNSIKNYTPAQIEQTYYALTNGKASFKSAYDQMINAEKDALKLYAAVAMGLKDMSQPESEEYADSVLSKLQKNTNEKLGMYFVFLRSFTEKVILPLKNEILSNEKVQEFLIKEKVEIAYDEKLSEILLKLETLDKKAKKMYDEGLLSEKISLSLDSQIAYFLDSKKAISQNQ